MNDQKDNPSYLNRAYQEMRPAWQIVDDCAEGTLRLRAVGKQYLPMEPAEDQRDYDPRLQRSIFFNSFERSLNGLVGMVFRKEPKLGDDVPVFIRGTDGIEGIAENIDNAGSHWTVFAKEVFTDAMRQGHAAILVDMPTGPAYAYEIARGRKRPYWIGYRADQIVNWRSAVVDGQTVLDQVTLRECSMEPDGMFGEVEVVKYRTLRRMNGAGVDLDGETVSTGGVWWTIYRESKDGDGRTVYVVESEGVLPLSEIPLAPIYARKTGFFTSRPPLLDLALINIAHYQKYSDFSTYEHVASRPLLWFRGRDKNKKVEAIGPYVYFDVDADNGHVGFAETTGAALGVCQADLEHLEKQMAALGLAILAGNKPTNTATEALLDHVQSDSDLATAARSLKDAVEQCLKWTVQHVDASATSGGSIELGTTLEQLTLTPEEMRVWMDAADRVFSRETVYKVLGRAGKLPEDFDAAKEARQIEASGDRIGESLLSAFDRGR